MANPKLRLRDIYFGIKMASWFWIVHEWYSWKKEWENFFMERRALWQMKIIKRQNLWQRIEKAIIGIFAILFILALIAFVVIIIIGALYGFAQLTGVGSHPAVSPP